MTPLEATVTLEWAQISILTALLDTAVKEGRYKNCEALAAILEDAKLRSIENLDKS